MIFMSRENLNFEMIQNWFTHLPRSCVHFIDRNTNSNTGTVTVVYQYITVVTQRNVETVARLEAEQPDRTLTKSL